MVDGKPDSADHAIASSSFSAAWSASRAGRTRTSKGDSIRPSWQIPARRSAGASVTAQPRPPELAAPAETQGGSPAEFAEPFVADAEVVRDLVDDGAAHLVGHLLLGIADRADRQAVDGDPVREDAGVLSGAAGQRHALVQAEQAAGPRAVLDGDRDIAHHRAELLRQSVECRYYHFFEELRLDLDHTSIVQRRRALTEAAVVCNREAGTGVITVTRLTEPTQSEGN